MDDVRGLFTKGGQVILYQKCALLIWVKASVEGLGLHAGRLDISAMSELALGPDATTLSKELHAGAGGPTTPPHGSAHRSVPPRKDVGL